MSLHIEPTEDAVETLRKERRKNYIAALATSILSVVLAGAILYSLTIIIAPPEEPKVVGYITPDDAPPSDTPPPPEVQRETSSSSHAETPVKVVVAAAAAPVSLPKIDIDPPDEPVMLEEGTALGMGDGFGPDLGDATSAFGTSKPSGSTLVGTFYDTKQTPGGRPTNMNMNQYREFLSRFVNKGWNESELNAALETKLLPEGTNYVTREKLEKWDYPLAIQKITAKTIKEYEKKIEEISAMGVDFSDVERRVLLMTVDRNWIDHIDAMDQLRKGIGLRAYGQVDPIISYKKEGFDMFDEMVERIQRTTISVLLKVRIELRQNGAPARPAQPAQPQGERKAFRRQMPEPIQNMSSYKEAQAKAAAAAQNNQPENKQ